MVTRSLASQRSQSFPVEQCLVHALDEDLQEFLKAFYDVSGP